MCLISGVGAPRQSLWPDHLGGGVFEDLPFVGFAVNEDPADLETAHQPLHPGMSQTAVASEDVHHGTVDRFGHKDVDPAILGIPVHPVVQGDQRRPGTYPVDLDPLHSSRIPLLVAGWEVLDGHPLGRDLEVVVPGDGGTA